MVTLRTHQCYLKKTGLGIRPLNLNVAICAIAVLRVQVVLAGGRLNRADVMGHAMARQTKLRDAAGRQQPRIGRAVRRMTGAASFGLHGRVLESERSLLVRVAFHTSRIGAGGQSRLF